MQVFVEELWNYKGLLHLIKIALLSENITNFKMSTLFQLNRGKADQRKISTKPTEGM